MIWETHMSNKKIWQHNAVFWDQEALAQNPWSQPVSKDVTTAAKEGKWAIHITTQPLPTSWLPQNIQDKDILCLASAGGQQAPVLAAAGANITVFDGIRKAIRATMGCY